MPSERFPAAVRAALGPGQDATPPPQTLVRRPSLRKTPSPPPSPPPEQRSQLTPSPSQPPRPPPSAMRPASEFRARLAELQSEDSLKSSGESLSRLEGYEDVHRRKIHSDEASTRQRELKFDTMLLAAALRQLQREETDARREIAVSCAASWQSMVPDIWVERTVVEEQDGRNDIERAANIRRTGVFGTSCLAPSQHAPTDIPTEEEAELSQFHVGIRIAALAVLQRGCRCALALNRELVANGKLFDNAIRADEAAGRTLIATQANNVLAKMMPHELERQLLSGLEQQRCRERVLAPEQEARSQIRHRKEVELVAVGAERSGRGDIFRNEERQFFLILHNQTCDRAVRLPERVEREALLRLRDWLRSERHMSCLSMVQQFFRNVKRRRVGRSGFRWKLREELERHRSSGELRNWRCDPVRAREVLANVEAANARDYDEDGNRTEAYYEHRCTSIAAAETMARNALVRQWERFMGPYEAERLEHETIVVAKAILDCLLTEKEKRFEIRVEAEAELKCLRVELLEQRARLHKVTFLEAVERSRAVRNHRYSHPTDGLLLRGAETVQRLWRGIVARRRVATIRTQQMSEELALSRTDPERFAAIQAKKKERRRSRHQFVSMGDLRRGARVPNVSSLVEDGDDYDEYAAELYEEGEAIHRGKQRKRKFDGSTAGSPIADGSPVAAANNESSPAFNVAVESDGLDQTTGELAATSRDMKLLLSTARGLDSTFSASQQQRVLLSPLSTTTLREAQAHSVSSVPYPSGSPLNFTATSASPWAIAKNLPGGTIDGLEPEEASELSALIDRHGASLLAGEGSASSKEREAHKEDSADQQDDDKPAESKKDPGDEEEEEDELLVDEENRIILTDANFPLLVAAVGPEVVYGQLLDALEAEEQVLREIIADAYDNHVAYADAYRRIVFFDILRTSDATIYLSKGLLTAEGEALLTDGRAARRDYALGAQFVSEKQQIMRRHVLFAEEEAFKELLNTIRKSEGYIAAVTFNAIKALIKEEGVTRFAEIECYESEAREFTLVPAEKFARDVLTEALRNLKWFHSILPEDADAPQEEDETDAEYIMRVTTASVKERYAYRIDNFDTLDSVASIIQRWWVRLTENKRTVGDTVLEAARQAQKRDHQERSSTFHSSGVHLAVADMFAKRKNTGARAFNASGGASSPLSRRRSTRRSSVRIDEDGNPDSLNASPSPSSLSPQEDGLRKRHSTLSKMMLPENYSLDFHTGVVAARYSLDFDINSRIAAMQEAAGARSSTSRRKSKAALVQSLGWIEDLEALERDDLLHIQTVQLETWIWKPLMWDGVLAPAHKAARDTIEDAEASFRRDFEEACAESIALIRTEMFFGALHAMSLWAERERLLCRDPIPQAAWAATDVMIEDAREKYTNREAAIDAAMASSPPRSAVLEWANSGGISPRSRQKAALKLKGDFRDRGLAVRRYARRHLVDALLDCVEHAQRRGRIAIALESWDEHAKLYSHFVTVRETAKEASAVSEWWRCEPDVTGHALATAPRPADTPLCTITATSATRVPGCLALPRSIKQMWINKRHAADEPEVAAPPVEEEPVPQEEEPKSESSSAAAFSSDEDDKDLGEEFPSQDEAPQEEQPVEEEEMPAVEEEEQQEDSDPKPADEPFAPDEEREEEQPEEEPEEEQVALRPRRHRRVSRIPAGAMSLRVDRFIYHPPDPIDEEEEFEEDDDDEPRYAPIPQPVEPCVVVMDPEADEVIYNTPLPGEVGAAPDQTNPVWQEATVLLKPHHDELDIQMWDKVTLDDDTVVSDDFIGDAKLRVPRGGLDGLDFTAAPTQTIEVPVDGMDGKQIGTVVFVFQRGDIEATPALEVVHHLSEDALYAKDASVSPVQKEQIDALGLIVLGQRLPRYLPSTKKEGISRRQSRASVVRIAEDDDDPDDSQPAQEEDAKEAEQDHAKDDVRDTESLEMDEEDREEPAAPANDVDDADEDEVPGGSTEQPESKFQSDRPVGSAGRSKRVKVVVDGGSESASAPGSRIGSAGPQRKSVAFLPDDGDDAPRPTSGGYYRRRASRRASRRRSSRRVSRRVSKRRSTVRRRRRTTMRQPSTMNAGEDSESSLSDFSFTDSSDDDDDDDFDEPWNDYESEFDVESQYQAGPDDGYEEEEGVLDYHYELRDNAPRGAAPMRLYTRGMSRPAAPEGRELMVLTTTTTGEDEEEDEYETIVDYVDPLLEEEDYTTLYEEHPDEEATVEVVRFKMAPPRAKSRPPLRHKRPNPFKRTADCESFARDRVEVAELRAFDKILTAGFSSWCDAALATQLEIDAVRREAILKEEQKARDEFFEDSTGRWHEMMFRRVALQADEERARTEVMAEYAASVSEVLLAVCADYAEVELERRRLFDLLERRRWFEYLFGDVSDEIVYSIREPETKLEPMELIESNARAIVMHTEAFAYSTHVLAVAIRVAAVHESVARDEILQEEREELHRSVLGFRGRAF